MSDRIQEINLEIKTLLKTDPTSKKLESLQRELKELLIKKRLPPTIFKALNEKERKPRKQKQISLTLSPRKKKQMQAPNPPNRQPTTIKQATRQP